MSCHFSTPTRAHKSAHSRTIAITLALLVAGANSPVALAVPLVDEALDRQAREILAAHCPPCVEAGSARRTVRNGDPTALDLAAIARDPRLVRPGNPDGSPVYATLVRRLFTPAKPPAPSIEALSAFRTWIERLPALAASCPSTPDASRSHIEQLLTRQANVQRLPIANLRVLTLAHVDMGCTPPARLAEWRQALGLFLSALAGSAAPSVPLALDEHGHLLTIDIQALGWDGHRWRALTGAGQRAARSTEPLVVRADWLVLHVLRGELGARSANLEAAPPQKPKRFHDPEITDTDRAIAHAMLARVATPETVAHQTELLLDLVRAYLAPATLPQIAAELGIERRLFERQFAEAAGGVKGLLLRLAYSAISREEVEDGWLLISRIGGAPPPQRTNAPIQFDAARPQITSETPVELELYADKPRYAVGDAVELTIRSNVDCRLTVISIDTSGHGTVIFPNDFAPRDLLSAHLNLALPARDAGYRFRVKEKGRERVVALCTRAAGLIDGITHDFERQRFQELGPYSAFLDNALRNAQKRRAAALVAAAEAAKAAAAEDEREGRERSDPDGDRPRATGTPPAAVTEPSGPAHAPLHQIWRTGIVIEVE